MRSFLALTLPLLISGIAHASTPTGARHGAWHVVSITSISGVSADDASAILVQENDAGRIELDWQEGGDVVFSFHIPNCTGDDDELAHHDSLTAAALARTPLPALTRRLESNVSTWLDEARRTCRNPGRLDLFQLQLFAEAVADFTGRVRALGSLG